MVYVGPNGEKSGEARGNLHVLRYTTDRDEATMMAMEQFLAASGAVRPATPEELNALGFGDAVRG